MPNKKNSGRRGATAALVAICLAAIVGVVALAMDGGVLLDKRRSVQAAADAAAMAAAVDLFDNYSLNLGLDPNGTANASALSTAAANGFNNDGTTSVVTINIPPSSGIAQATSSYAEVIVQANQKRAFSAIFGSGTIPVQARAVACGNPGGIGMYLLQASGGNCLDVEGNVSLLNNAVINVNSNANGAAQINGTGNLTCGGINVVGTFQNHGGTVTYTGGGSLNQGAAAVTDPLASIAEPSASGTNYNDVHLTTTQTIQPGIYHNIQINWGVNVTMAPGTYYINGGIQFQGPPANQPGGTLSGNSVLIYNNSGDNCHFDQAGGVNLSAPTSGPYRGIVWWQPRNSNKVIHFESNNNITMRGTLYSQGGLFDFRPDGASTTFTFGSYVAQQIVLCDGNDQQKKSNGTIVFNPGEGVSTQRPLLVE